MTRNDDREPSRVSELRAACRKGSVPVIPWWVWPVLLLGVVGFVWLHLVKPVHHHHVPLSRLRPLLAEFVARGRVQSVLILEREDGPGMLQFKLLDTSPTTRTVECGLPYVDWSAEQFDNVVAAVRNAGFLTGETGAARCSTVRRFLRVPTEDPLRSPGERSGELLSVVAARLGWQSDTLVTVHAEIPLGTRAADLVRRLKRART